MDLLTQSGQSDRRKRRDRDSQRMCKMLTMRPQQSKGQVLRLLMMMMKRERSLGTMRPV